MFLGFLSKPLIYQIHFWIQVIEPCDKVSIMRISWVYLNLALRAELLHNELHDLLFYHIEKYSLPFFFNQQNWNSQTETTSLTLMSKMKQQITKTEIYIEIPKLENNNLINLGVQDEEAESHKTGRKNKITKSNWNSGAEMTLVVNQCARWRSGSPNRNYKIPKELARIPKHRNAIFLQCLHNRSHKTEIQFLEGSLQEQNHEFYNLQGT